MNIAYFEMIGGAAGNMIVAALIDAGADVQLIDAGLKTIPITGWALKVTRRTMRGLAASHVEVIVSGEDGCVASTTDQPRSLSDVLDLIQRSGLSDRQKETASRVYRRLAEAEAHIHGVPVEHIHFHEVGQIDAIIDVAAAVIALDQLGINRIVCSPFPVGHGLIQMDHGLFPNPPPATLELMRNAPVTFRNVEAELVTPTGAALLATLADRFGGYPSMLLSHVGYGAGSHELPFPNVLRVCIGVEPQKEAETATDEVAVLEATIDDMLPQHFELALERIMARGALDIWRTPVLMKKSRIGTLLSVICRPADADACAATILQETTTIGLRARSDRKYRLSRSMRTVNTPWGDLRVKDLKSGQHSRWTLEYDDVLRIARETNLPIGDVHRRLVSIVESVTQ